MPQARNPATNAAPTAYTDACRPGWLVAAVWASSRVRRRLGASAGGVKSPCGLGSLRIRIRLTWLYPPDDRTVREQMPVATNGADYETRTETAESS